MKGFIVVGNVYCHLPEDTEPVTPPALEEASVIIPTREAHESFTCIAKKDQTNVLYRCFTRHPEEVILCVCMKSRYIVVRFYSPPTHGHVLKVIADELNIPPKILAMRWKQFSSEKEIDSCGYVMISNESPEGEPEEIPIVIDRPFDILPCTDSLEEMECNIPGNTSGVWIYRNFSEVDFMESERDSKTLDDLKLELAENMKKEKEKDFQIKMLKEKIAKYEMSDYTILSTAKPVTL